MYLLIYKILKWKNIFFFYNFILMFMCQIAFSMTSHESFEEGITFTFFSKNALSSDEKLKYLKYSIQSFQFALTNNNGPSLSTQDRLLVVEQLIYSYKATESNEYDTQLLELNVTMQALQDQLKKEDEVIKTNTLDMGELNFWVPRFHTLKTTTLPAKVIYTLIKRLKLKHRFLKITFSPDYFLKSVAQQVKINSQNLNPDEQKMLISILEKWNSKKPKPEGPLKSYPAGIYGNTLEQSTAIHEEFFSFSAPKSISDHMPVVDIGCAYGTNTHKALLKGARVLAVDLDPSLLSVLVQSTPKIFLDRLDIHLGKFTEKNLNFDPDSIKAVLISHVIHYLHPHELIKGLNEIHQALEKNGKLYVFSITPFHGKLNDKEIELITQTTDQALQSCEYLGDIDYSALKTAFPTYIEYLYSNEKGFFEKNPFYCIIHPHLSQVSKIYLEKNGFSIDKAENYISPMQVENWECFKKTGFKIFPQFIIPNLLENYRAFNREDFKNYRDQMTLISPLFKDLAEILGDSNTTWPIKKADIGGNMYIVGTKL